MVIAGAFFALLQGFSMPVMLIFIREMMGSFSTALDITNPGASKAGWDEMRQWTINLSFLALVSGFTAFTNNYFFTYVAKKNVHNTRVAFLTRCLEMDSEFFDKNSPNEMAAKLMINAEELYDGTGSTVALGL
jgi:ABC-type multidrug transport system fused ATPase/permease subunit